jgi:hypothetical protein
MLDEKPCQATAAVNRKVSRSTTGRRHLQTSTRGATSPRLANCLRGVEPEFPHLGIFEPFGIGLDRKQTGLSREELLARLSRELPDAVDKYTPHGRLPTETDFPRS